MRNKILIFFVFGLVSCERITYENHHSFNESGWNTDSVLTFKYMISDSLKPYDLKLNIRHTVDYQYQNLFLFLKGDNQDTIEIILSDKNGKWKGRGVSDVRELTHDLNIKRVFSKTGEHTLKLEQAMRYGDEEKIKNLEDILDIGLIILEHNE